jgi:3-hydroxybutyryl-CoA dehydrogenase
MEIKKIFMAGAGLMGAGIAQVSAAAGYEVLLWDINGEMLKKATDKLTASLQGRVDKNKMSAEAKDAILKNIVTTEDLESAKEAQLVIEAIPENAEMKNSLFEKLDKICPAETIFASNTSSLPISGLANATNREDRFIGLHFFSPVPVMKLVEIIKGLKTSDETYGISKGYIEKIGKTGVSVKDTPGFLINRIMHGFRQEVLACMEEGIASIEDIDTAVKLGLGHPMGPFELNDFAGIDIGAATIQTLYDNFKDPKWRPNLTMKKLVAAGDLGRKTGKGWYDYSSGEKKPRSDVNF